MNKEKLEHFRSVLTEQLGRRSQNVREDQANALEATDDGVKDSADMSVQDVSQETALRLGERESQMIAEIDQALLRIDEGTYGTCERCGKEIDERRLEAVPTARFDAKCQEDFEASLGLEDAPTL